MEGATAGGSRGGAPDLPPAAGIIPRAFRHIFAAISASADQTFLVQASMLEIYQEEVRDLLAKVGAPAWVLAGRACTRLPPLAGRPHGTPAAICVAQLPCTSSFLLSRVWLRTVPLLWAAALMPQNPTARLELHEAREGGVYVKGLNTFVVKSEAEIAAVLEVGGSAPGQGPAGPWQPQGARPRAGAGGFRRRQLQPPPTSVLPRACHR